METCNHTGSGSLWDRKAEGGLTGGGVSLHTSVCRYGHACGDQRWTSGVLPYHTLRPYMFRQGLSWSLELPGCLPISEARPGYPFVCLQLPRAGVTGKHTILGFYMGSGGPTQALRNFIYEPSPQLSLLDINKYHCDHLTLSCPNCLSHTVGPYRDEFMVGGSLGRASLTT